MEIETYFLGVARVQLFHLQYAERPDQPDDCIGCCVSDQLHHVPALIASCDLEKALGDSGTANHELYRVAEHPMLPLPRSMLLPCLHGKHWLCGPRAKGNLDDWWTVDLYSSGTVVRQVPRLSAC